MIGVPYLPPLEKGTEGDLIMGFFRLWFAGSENPTTCLCERDSPYGGATWQSVFYKILFMNTHHLNPCVSDTSPDIKKGERK